jgi:hypothetical protein
VVSTALASRASSNPLTSGRILIMADPRNKLVSTQAMLGNDEFLPP